MKFFSVGTQWDTEGMMEVLSLNNEQCQINDIYGSLAFSPTGHGRSPYAVPQISEQKAKEHIKAIQENGVEFNYLLNGNFDPARLKNQTFYDNILRYIDFVVEDLKINFVTIAVPELIEIMNKNYPELQVKISTVFNVLSVEDLQKLRGLKFQKVTLGNDAPRNFYRLSNLLKYAEGECLQLEIMISETCLYQCPTRQAHYRKQTRDDVDYSTDWYMNNCTLSRIMHPEEIFKACWIRPEDLEVYVQLGLKNFKISGRSKGTDWTKRCLNAYFEESYEGNLMEILGTTPPDYENNSDYLFYINNNSLEKFLNHHPKKCLDLDCDKCKYCLETALTLFEKGQFKINSICGTYEIKDDKFICTPGGYASELIRSIKANKGL